MRVVQQSGFGFIPAADKQFERYIFMRDVWDAQYQRSGILTSKTAEHRQNVRAIGNMLESVEERERRDRSMAHRHANDRLSSEGVGEVDAMHIEPAPAKRIQTFFVNVEAEIGEA